MRMSDTVTVKESSETMRGPEAEETSSAPGVDRLGKSESREQVEPDGTKNCCDHKSDTQVTLYEKRPRRQLPISPSCPAKYTVKERIFSIKGDFPTHVSDPKGVVFV